MGPGQPCYKALVVQSRRIVLAFAIACGYAFVGCDGSDDRSPKPPIVTPQDDNPCTNDGPDGGDDDAGADSPIPALCVWTRAKDFDAIVAKPSERREIEAEVTINDEHVTGAVFELHGGSARSWEKKSFRLAFGDDVPKFDYFGDGAAKQRRLVLQAAWIDQTFVRAKLAMDLTRETGGLAPRVGYVRLFVNGKLLGLYQAIERIDGQYLDRNDMDDDGNLYKAESHDANWRVHKNPLMGFDEKSDLPGGGEDLTPLFAACQDTALSEDAFEAAVAPLVNLHDFFVWHQIMSFADNRDTFDKNYYLFHDPNAAAGTDEAKFRIIQWDADTTFGNWWTGTRIKDPERARLFGTENACANRLFTIPAYRRQYLEGYEDLLETKLNADILWPRAEALLDLLEDDIRRDLKQWNREGTYEDEKQFLHDMIDLRYEVMRDAVDEALEESEEDGD